MGRDPSSAVASPCQRDGADRDPVHHLVRDAELGVVTAAGDGHQAHQALDPASGERLVAEGGDDAARRLARIEGDAQTSVIHDVQELVHGRAELHLEAGYDLGVVRVGQQLLLDLGEQHVDGPTQVVDLDEQQGPCREVRRDIRVARRRHHVRRRELEVAGDGQMVGRDLGVDAEPGRQAVEQAGEHLGALLVRELRVEQRLECRQGQIDLGDVVGRRAGARGLELGRVGKAGRGAREDIEGRLEVIHRGADQQLLVRDRVGRAAHGGDGRAGVVLRAGRRGRPSGP